MSDFTYLNRHRVRQPVPSANIPQRYCSDDSYGFNGMFRLPWQDRLLRVIASDGLGWQHVSVSVERDSRCPTWEAMCFVKGLFWDSEDWVLQFHPAESDYVNNHEGCLHLWKPIGRDFPVPDSILVGLRKKDIDRTGIRV
jgi:hypothetical protein